VSQVATRYARALSQALENQNLFESTRPVLVALSKLPTDLMARLADPTIPLSARENALRLSLGNPSTDSLLGRFIELLARKRRLGIIDSICQIVLEMDRAKAGIVDGNVTSHTSLEPGIVTKLASSLSAPGRTVQLTNSVDSSILGGFRVRLGATVLDATINNQLQQARKALLSA
jgi:F-type H+-transporting ATPase subunit delta